MGVALARFSAGGAAPSGDPSLSRKTRPLRSPSPATGAATRSPFEPRPGPEASAAPNADRSAPAARTRPVFGVMLDPPAVSTAWRQGLFPFASGLARLYHFEGAMEAATQVRLDV